MTKHWKQGRAHIRLPTLQSVHLPSLRKRDRELKLERAAVGAGSVGALSIGAVSVGALAVGAIAIGALAIGALAVKRLTIKRARIERLSIGTLEVDRLIVREQVTPAGLDVVADERT